MIPAAISWLRVEWRSLLSGLFFVAAWLVCGAALGVAIGVPLDKAIHSHPHGFPGLLGLLLGVPLGALVGLVVGAARVRRLAPGQRVCRGLVALLIACVCALGLFLAVQTGRMRW